MNYVFIIKWIFEHELESSLISIKQSLKKLMKNDFMKLLSADIETENKDNDYLFIRQCIRNIKKAEKKMVEILLLSVVIRMIIMMNV